MKKNNDENIKKEEKKELKVLSTSEISKGVYSNLAVINHNENEFILDFLLRLRSETQLVSRVILSPEHMKRFNKVIEESIKKFDKTNKTKK